MSNLTLMMLETIPRMRRILVAALRQRGVRHSIPQLQILDLIAARPHTVSELAALQDVSKATMSATLTRMGSQGLIQRERAPDDRRIVWISPTDHGQTVRSEARTQAQSILEELLAPLSPQEMENLACSLKPLISALEQSQAPNPPME